MSKENSEIEKNEVQNADNKDLNNVENSKLTDITPEEKQAMIDEILSFDNSNTDNVQGMPSEDYTQNVYQNRDFGEKIPKKPMSLGVQIAICVVTAVVCFFAGVLGGYVYDYDHPTTVTQVNNFQQASNTSSNVTITEIAQDGTVTVNGSIADSVSNVLDSVVLVKSTLSNGTSSGSGVIFGYDGEAGYSYIMTNHHVIEGATSVKVYTYSGDTYDATLVGSSASADLAVLKVHVTGLKAVTFGTSSTLKIGDTVFAVGNALGQGYSVSRGIISAKDRQITMDLVTYHLLQTDASINSGNSGGGLFDASGNLIGIVNAKSFGTGIEGMGYAIPIDEAKDIAIKLLQNTSGGYGYVPGSVYFGLSAEDYTNNNQGYIHITSSSVSDTNSYKVGTSNFNFSSNDYISKIEFGGNANVGATTLTGTTLTCANFISLIAKLEVGDTLTMTVIRLSMFGNTAYEVEVVVGQYIYPN